MENYLSYITYMFFKIKYSFADWQFNWGGYLLKCNGGVYKSNFSIYNIYANL